jgi:hypothetical protein
MASVTLQFSRPDLEKEKWSQRIVSEGIMKETRSEICHVDIVTPEGTLIGAHIEDGIRERQPDYQAWGLRIRVTIPATEEQAAKLYAYARSMIGTPYDSKDILGIALGDARLHDSAKMICSGFASEAIDTQSGIVRVAKDHWQVSPEELRMVLASQPGAVEQRIEGNGLAKGATA